MKPALRPRKPEAAEVMRLAAFAFLFSAAAVGALAAADLPATLSNGISYVSLDEGAARLGLRLERSFPVTTVMLKDGARPVARLADHSRDADLKGLRVFLGDPVLERSGKFYISRIDYDSRLVPRLRPDLCGPLPRQPQVIAIDPGHGGTDDGTENRTYHSMEKTYTLDVAERLKKLLSAQGYKVVMTRETDVDVPKQIRSEIANRAKADLLVSIHFNSLYPNTKTTGVEIMLFPPRSQRSANSWSPGQKNDAEEAPAPVNSFDAWNTVLAGGLHRRLLDALKTGDRGEKFEHLGVLRGLRCPGVLVESAFLSSDAEAARLATPAYRETIAAAVLAGIQDYTDVIRRLHPAAVAVPAGPAAPPHGQVPAVAPAASPRSLPNRPAAFL
jgi:N-acetylmuramoyl-L-alanine amidase